MKKKTLAYVIGGEARLVAETYKQDEIYKQLCEKYKVHTYIHSWTQIGKWTKDNEKYRYGDGTRPETSAVTKYYPPDWEIVKNNKETILNQYSIYNPKFIEVEDYDPSFNVDNFPCGQYISRAKAFRSIAGFNLKNANKYDYVWLGRSDAAGKGPLPEFQEGKIHCPEISFDDDCFRAEDWYYAGPYEMFKNLLPWADDPLTSIESIQENPWLMELGERRVKNTHIWQAILTGDAGENIFLRDEIEWKLLTY
jgi:hypothetical protein